MISTKPFHTFQLDSTAQSVIYITEQSQLSELDLPIPSIILGQGSNTIFINDYKGQLIVNQLKGINVLESDDSFVIKVKSGENWHKFVKYCLSKKIYGFENLALIPGTVGAAPIQNIGAYGVEIEKFINKVEYYDFELKKCEVLSNQECLFAYRDSIFKHDLKDKAFITEVEFVVPKAWQAEQQYAPLDNLNAPSAMDIYNLVCDTRKSKLPNPYEVGNAGSFFKNPIVSIQLGRELSSQYPTIPIYPIDNTKVKLAAGWLIDQCNLKGIEHKSVAVHSKQALVLINKTGQANGADLLELVTMIQYKVNDKFNVSLEPEVRLIADLGEIQI